jgi:hypothetical protein
MSPSTRSKPASASSPATGGESKAGAAETVTIDLEVSRQRWIGWTLGGIVGGILLVLKLGTVGVWGGYVLIALGVWRGYQLAMSFLHPAGKFIVGPSQITLPRGAYRPRPIVVEPSAIKSVYFLRRSVPWNRSSPVLIIEVGDTAHVYPRDWFASEADQRHLVGALRSHLPALRTMPDGDKPVNDTASEPADAKAAAAES